MTSVYEQVYQRSMRDPAGFWAGAAEDIYWERRWDKVFDDSRKPFYRWFAGGRLNTCFNALDLHIERGRGKQLALIYDSPVTGTVKSYTYAAFRDEVARTAGALVRQGIAGLRVPGSWGMRAASSGSTGRPARFLWPLEQMRWLDAGEARARAWLGSDVGTRRLEVRCRPVGRMQELSAVLLNTAAFHAPVVADVAAVRRLVDEALARGTTDNVTVVVVHPA